MDKYWLSDEYRELRDAVAVEVMGWKLENLSIHMLNPEALVCSDVPDNRWDIDWECAGRVLEKMFVMGVRFEILAGYIEAYSNRDGTTLSVADADCDGIQSVELLPKLIFQAALESVRSESFKETSGAILHAEHKDGPNISAGGEGQASS